MADLIDRIQAYLHNNYETQMGESVAADAFQMYFACAEAESCSGLAVPCQRTITHADALLEMEDAFWQRHQSPHIQFLDSYNPVLAALLEQNGYDLVTEEMVLVCTPNSIRPAPEMPGLTTLILSAESSLADVEAGLQQTSQLGFDPFAATRLLDTSAEMLRRTLVTGQAFVLRLHKKPVATGMFKASYEGLIQLTGLTTLADYRRQGFAAYLTSYMTKYAFSRHVDTVFLTTAVDGTETVYRRVGFKPRATLLTFRKEF